MLAVTDNPAETSVKVYSLPVRRMSLGMLVSTVLSKDRVEYSPSGEDTSCRKSDLNEIRERSRKSV
jgi:hypothetical protein